MSRYDPYSASVREEQKAILNGLLGIIYDSYDTTRRTATTVDSLYRIAVTILVLFILCILVAIGFGCYFGCRRYQSEQLHQSRKAAPIEI